MNVLKINITVSKHREMFHEYPEFGLQDKDYRYGTPSKKHGNGLRISMNQHNRWCDKEQ